jgi:hypothetical protein
MKLPVLVMSLVQKTTPGEGGQETSERCNQSK